MFIVKFNLTPYLLLKLERYLAYTIPWKRGSYRRKTEASIHGMSLNL